MRRMHVLGISVVAAAGVAVASFGGAGGPPEQTVVYVTSQGLFYDSIVLNDLPPRGKFQLLEMGPLGLQTEFGPGDAGYLGGRWWMDANSNGELDPDADVFFLCPLLPPGRLTP